MITIVKLEDFIFNFFEVPESIPFGTNQICAVHELIGGKRVIDAMGRSDVDITWSGYFLGIDAAERVQYIKGLAISGKELTFSYAQFSFKVYIKSFTPSFERTYQIPFTITLGVVEDLTKPVNIIFPSTFDDAITDALIQALDIAYFVANPGLDSSLALIGIAIQTIPSFADASVAELASVVSSINNAQSTVGSLIGGL